MYRPAMRKSKAELLVKQCIHHLSVFEEERVAILIDLAKFLLERRS
jgi:hypothetical protein